MSSLLARLGHLQARNAAHSLRINGKKSTPNEVGCVDCRAKCHEALSQSRSYGDNGSSRMFSTQRHKRAVQKVSTPPFRHTRQRREIHHTAASRERNAHDPNDPNDPNGLNDVSTFPVYPARDTRRSKRTENTTRGSKNAQRSDEDEDVSLWESFERDYELDEDNDQTEKTTRGSKNAQRLDEDEDVSLWESFERDYELDEDNDRTEKTTRGSRNAQRLDEDEELSPWESFERDNELNKDNYQTERRPNASATLASLKREGDKRLDIDYRTRLPSALLHGEADTVVRCLFAADRDFVKALPAATFSEIIRVLEPRNFMSPPAAVHFDLSAAMAHKLQVAPMREVAYEYASVLKEAVGLRRGIRLTLSDYKSLLRSARDLGNQRFSRMLWDHLLIEEHKPDTKCYNLYMSSLLWNGLHSAGARQKTRVIDFNMAARKKETPKPNFRHYRVGAGGLREVAMSIFNDMLANGVIANEETFRILITAASREGDLETMKSVLKKVWNIDVDAFLAGEDEATITPKSLQPDSALYPTPQLLFTIADAFGSNNDIPSALRTVDFVARHYQLPITLTVWERLFEWTFVLALERIGTHRKTGSDAGQLPGESVMSLYNTMTSAPYYIQPTMGMYNYLIKILWEQGESMEMLEHMREGRKLHSRNRRHARNLWYALEQSLELESNSPLQPDREKLRLEYEAADLVRKQGLFRLKRWLRLLLASSRSSDNNHFAFDIPGILWEWRSCAPTKVRYELPTGFLEFSIRTWEEMASYAMSSFAHKSNRRHALKKVERYIGDRWIVGEVRPAKRLLPRK